MKKKWTTKFIAKWLVIISFIIVTIILTLWTYVDLLFPSLKIQSFLGITAGILLAVFLYFDDRLNTLGSSSTVYLNFTGFGEAFLTVSQKMRIVRKMRVYAISSGKILPLFSSNDIYVDECHVILRNLAITDINDQEGANFQKEIEQMIKEWTYMTKKGRIKNLKVDRYSFLPTEYQVIFDNKMMITGLYSPNKDNYSQVDVEDPLIIDDSTYEGKQFIERYIARFDSLSNYLKV